MKKLLLFSLLFLGMINLKAQETHFGAKLAGSFSTIKASGDIASFWNDNSKGKLNFELGLVGELMLTEQFALATEFNYAESGDVANVTIEGFKSEVKLLTSYIQVPVMARYYVNENINLNFGPQIGFLLSARDETKITLNGQTETDSDDLKDDVNSTELGLIIGGGYKFNNGLFLDIRYNLGLSELFKEGEDGNFKSRALKFGIGYYFN